jgi:hypothetical protein
MTADPQAPPKFDMDLSKDAKVAAKQQKDFDEWPINRVVSCDTPAFAGTEGPVPANRFASAEFTPKRLFSLFFNDAVCNHLIEHSNRNGLRKFGPLFQRFERRSFEAFLGTLIRMGHARFDDIRCYWDEAKGWDPVRAVWPRNAFLTLLYALHTDTSPKPSDKACDRLWDIRRLNELLNHAFADALQPPRELACDETMLKYRGKHDSFQMMPAKPIKRGFKCWTLADSCGYVYGQHLYVGKGGPASEFGVTYDCVMKLMEPYFWKWHVVATDSFFTSLDLVRHLYDRKTLAVGKVHPNRRFPRHLRNASIGRDQFLTLQNTKLSALSATKHCDYARESEYLSTAVSLPMKTELISPAASPHSYPAPSVAALYNRASGGVDTANRWAAFRSTHRKHYRAYYTFVEHYVNVAISNASGDPNPVKNISDFSWAVATELIGSFCARQRIGRPADSLALLHRHELRSGSRDERCVVCYSQAGGIETGHKTRWRCSCGVAVCHTNPSCFAAHAKTAIAAPPAREPAPVASA